MRREVAAGAGVHRHVERHRHRQRPHRVGLRLLLEGDREHPLVHAGLDQRGRDDRGRAADRAGGVHAQQRLAGGAERLGQEQLGHHHALEQVGRLADDDRVDVVEASARRPRARGRSPRGTGPAIETSSRLARWWVWPTPITAAGCLPISDRPSIDADEVLLQRRPAGGVAERLASPRRPRSAARPRRSGCSAAGEHRVAGERAARRVDRDVVAEARARVRRISSWWLNGACSSATSTPSRSERGAGAPRAEGERVRSRVPMLIGST